MNYKALIVDFGGVVTTRFRSALSSFCEREGLDPHRLHYVLREDPAGKAALFEAEAGRITQREFERQLGKLLAVSDVDLTQRICADLRPCESMLALVAQAKNAGVNTAMLSNSWGTGGYDIYTGYALPEYFDVVVVSDKVGYAKPDLEIYKFALAQLGLSANECIFADDVPRNLAPAATLGMTTVLVDEPADAVREIAQMLGLATV
ncbi:MAG: HAD family phosphatase [Actinophytocola sp.]|uniref:HAD family hydrolase n=1 Tax=Actinophytocola sp. TaxID=1872138 RepID=UPI003C75789A